MWTPDPIAFQIGPFVIRWYGILISIGMALGTYLAYREAEKQKLDPEHVINLVVVAIPLALLGARLYYVIFYNLEYYLANPGEVLAVWHGGLAIHGGLIGGILGGYLVVRHYKLNFWQMADIVAPSIILGQAIGRWGNFFNQEAYGFETDLPWAMYIDGAFRHPTFLYESIWNLMVFFILIFIRRKSFLRKGDLFAGYVILYSLGRVIIESFRTDSLMFGPFRVAQLASILGIIAGIAFILYNHRKKLAPANRL
ncbi:prolipoprotein diacylglyceryl transferase [Dehalobacterium formicoaceticum]|uniref:Phosphatidylglycerol--prolipoprotein diacylglyceryl transferase n=1 Tax=Dehalobacterium formicoaceticum TaxID=51515 RepID=A0ABT1Y647_9FIRM|nr:prolipoprotein diacylglyceryl transferase [Dehalobacterium formicoaceticum]MCR6545171.1 prolipoprotein diacylglyceryl transferase [Dehalobacterium formicoaceticum]